MVFVHKTVDVTNADAPGRPLQSVLLLLGTYVNSIRPENPLGGYPQ
jgi:hypothetical protein